MTLTLAAREGHANVQVDADVQHGVRLAETLANAEAGSDWLPDTEELRRFAEREQLSYADRIVDADVASVAALASTLRAVLRLDDSDPVGTLNALLVDAEITPQLVGHDDRSLHFHYLPRSGSFTDWFTAHVAMALLTVLRDTGSQRFGRCHAEGCERLFIDLSRNRSRRYCDPQTCANRANVAAYRRRAARTTRPPP